MADLIEQELGLVPMLEVGKSGEFTVWVDGACVAQKTLFGFPSDEECVDGVAKAIHS